MIELMREKYLGTVSVKNNINTVITNIRPIFDSIKEHTESISNFQGIYESCTFSLNNKDYHLVRISPGSPIIDIIKLMAPLSSSITLVGIAGSLNTGTLIGDVIFPREAMHHNSLGKSIAFTHRNGEGIICQTDGLVQTKVFYESLRDTGIDFVDMESYYIASYAHQYGIRSKVVSIVSDLPLEIPFYLAPIVSKFDMEKILYYLKVE
ncbi:5'-methylthioadenosine/S-adenosylhomocysteine nucleosidase [compost metagenome]